MGNTLIIGDLHAPFIKDGYLAHCKHIAKKHNCTRFHCTGDIIDNHRPLLEAVLTRLGKDIN